jgi:stearoyl-CoA desaturase (delta-9 desaturase)
LKRVKGWLHLEESELQAQDKQQLDSVLAKSGRLAKVYEMKNELSALWERSTATREQLVKQLNDWCARAEASGIAQLQEFSGRLRCYAA